MFADDSLLYNTTCSASAPNSSKPPQACCPLQEDASRVQSWADQWNTLFNAAKSSHMIISRSPVHSSPSITLHDIPVPYVTCTRHLGLLISSTLKVARTSCAAQPEIRPKWRPFSMETATHSDSLGARSTCRRTLTSTEEPKLVKLKGLSSRSVDGQTVTSFS